jgi:hypothetical protein
MCFQSLAGGENKQRTKVRTTVLRIYQGIKHLTLRSGDSRSGVAQQCAGFGPANFEALTLKRPLKALEGRHPNVPEGSLLIPILDNC